MNQIQFDELKPLEKFLEQATHDYLVNQSMSNKKVVFKIAEELGIKTGSITCSSCVLKAFKRVAEQFFEFKAKESEPAEPAEPAEPETKPTKKSKSPKSKSPKSK